EPLAVPAARIRQALRGRAPPARFTRAHGTLRQDDGDRHRLCAVAVDGAPDRGPSDAAVGEGLQTAPGAAGRLEVRRRRTGAAESLAAPPDQVALARVRNCAAHSSVSSCCVMSDSVRRPSLSIALPGPWWLRYTPSSEGSRIAMSCSIA